MRRTLAVGLLLVLAMAGCERAKSGDGVATAGGTATPSTSASANKQSEQDAMLAYAKCMRENGVPDFPDPKMDNEGGVSLNLPEGADKSKVDAAHEKCKKLMPNGGEPRKVDEAMLEKMRKYADCMRSNGVPKFPDPDPYGGFRIEVVPGLDPNDPTFRAADEKCEQYKPGEPGAGTTNQRGEG